MVSRRSFMTTSLEHEGRISLRQPEEMIPTSTRPRRSARALTSLIIAVCLTLPGCASYTQAPLPDAAEAGGAASAPVRAPLDMNAVATLAVLNNPQLTAARAKARVAAAQAFAAGILPEPTFDTSTDVPYDRVTSPRDPRYPEYHAYGFTLGINLQQLLTHSTRRAAADAAYRQAQEDLLWQEWQTVAQARTLYVAGSIAAARRAVLEPAERQYALAAEHSQRALARHDVTLDQAGADEAALAVVRTQLGTATREEVKAQHDLKALLGLGPEDAVPLEPLAAPVLPNRESVAVAVERLAVSRPDLRALQQGYLSEEAQLRIAVLSQFPNIVVGFNRARDVSDVHTNGGVVSLTLPLFDSSRGDIAVQRATRAQLRAEYQARVAQARAEVWTLWDEIAELRAELDDLDARMPTLERDAEITRRGFGSGNFPAASYFISVNALLVAQSTRFDLLNSLWSDSIALATVTGTQVVPGR
jgi:outer membrane protein TolC